jgi:hypothetical protein
VIVAGGLVILDIVGFLLWRIRKRSPQQPAATPTI